VTISIKRNTRMRARALLFVAVSGVAVPACQHFDGDTSQKSAQADIRPAPSATRVAVPADPRLPLPPRTRG
jgi:hypothetical protein